MSDLKEVISDLNVSIADTETLKSETPEDLQIYVSRAVGQLKAARGCLLTLKKQMSAQPGGNS